MGKGIVEADLQFQKNNLSVVLESNRKEGKLGIFLIAWSGDEGVLKQGNGAAEDIYSENLQVLVGDPLSRAEN